MRVVSYLRSYAVAVKQNVVDVLRIGLCHQLFFFNNGSSICPFRVISRHIAGYNSLHVQTAKFIVLLQIARQNSALRVKFLTGWSV